MSSNNVNINSFKNLKEIKKVTKLSTKKEIFIGLKKKAGTIKNMSGQLKAKADDLRMEMVSSGVFPLFKNDATDIFLMLLVRLWDDQKVDLSLFQKYIRDEFYGYSFESIHEYFLKLGKRFLKSNPYYSGKVIIKITLQIFMYDLSLIGISYNSINPGTGTYKPTIYEPDKLFQLKSGYMMSDPLEEEIDGNIIASVEKEEEIPKEKEIKKKDLGYIRAIYDKFPQGRHEGGDGKNLDFEIMQYFERKEYIHYVLQRIPLKSAGTKMINLFSFKGINKLTLNSNESIAASLFLMSHGYYIGRNENIEKFFNDNNNDFETIQNKVISIIRDECQYSMAKLVKKFIDLGFFNNKTYEEIEAMNTGDLVKAIHWLKSYILKRMFGLEVSYGSTADDLKIISSGTSIDSLHIICLTKLNYTQICKQTEYTPMIYKQEPFMYISTQRHFQVYSAKKKENNELVTTQNSTSNNTEKVAKLLLTKEEYPNSAIGREFLNDVKLLLKEKLDEIKYTYNLFLSKLISAITVKYQDKYDFQIDKRRFATFISAALMSFKDEFAFQSENIGKLNEFWKVERIEKLKRESDIMTETVKDVELNTSIYDANLFLPASTTDIYNITNEDDVNLLMKLIPSKLRRYVKRGKFKLTISIERDD